MERWEERISTLPKGRTRRKMWPQLYMRVSPLLLKKAKVWGGMRCQDHTLGRREKS
jgi:hypothetical protein